jgi:hypothetical protein
MAEITTSTLDEYHGTSTAIHARSENRLNENHIPPYQEVSQQPNTTKRKFKRNTERMSFEGTFTAWKALFQEKENKKKEQLAIVERMNARKMK